MMKYKQPYTGKLMKGLELEPLRGIYRELPNRGIPKEYCEKWKVMYLANYLGQPSLAFQYELPNGDLGGYHIKPKDKQCLMMGDISKCGMYGSWLHGDPTNKHLVITEGHEDCIACNIVIGDAGYNFTSLPHGNTSVDNFIKWHYNALSRYRSLILCFDNDGAGREATEAFIKRFNNIGKVRIAKLP